MTRHLLGSLSTLIHLLLPAACVLDPLKAATSQALWALLYLSDVCALFDFVHVQSALCTERRDRFTACNAGSVEFVLSVLVVTLQMDGTC